MKSDYLKKEPEGIDGNVKNIEHVKEMLEKWWINLILF